MNPEPEPKPNIFALPNQTTIIFGLIVTALLGAVCAGSLAPAPILIWPLALGLLVLPLRAFLARPERDLARRHLTPAGADLAGLQQVIADYARKIGLRRTPKLLVQPAGAKIALRELLNPRSWAGWRQPAQAKLALMRSTGQGPYTFGTFRHWYIAAGQDVALKWQEELAGSDDLASVVQAKLIHELYHFKTGDYWQLGYADELLRLTFQFMLWALFFSLGFGLMLFLAGPAIIQRAPAEWVNQIEGLSPEMRQMVIQLMPSASEMAEARKKMAGINMGLVMLFNLAALYPFVIVGLFLRLFYRPKLWRTREFYADAGVVQTQKETAPCFSALIKLPVSFFRSQYGQTEKPENSSRKERNFPDKITAWWKSLHLRSYHPLPVTRIASLKNPAHVFDTWPGTAALVGSFVLLLEISLLSSLTLLYVGEWPMHFPVLAPLIIISLSLIPWLVQGQAVWWNTLKIVGVVVALRLSLILAILGLLIFYLIVNPNSLLGMLNASVFPAARYAGPLVKLPFSLEELPVFVAQASFLNLAQVFIIFVVLIAALRAVLVLLRRLLTWYSFPQAERRLMNIAYLLIGLVTLFVGLIVLPILTIVLLRPAELFNLFSLTVGVLSFIIIAAGLGWFLYADRCYARHCPQCNKTVPGFYKLGKRCETCNQLLHPWLIANYES